MSVTDISSMNKQIRNIFIKKVEP